MPYSFGSEGKFDYIKYGPTGHKYFFNSKKTFEQAYIAAHKQAQAIEISRHSKKNN